MSSTVTGHQGAGETFWPHLREVFMSSVFQPLLLDTDYVVLLCVEWIFVNMMYECMCKNFRAISNNSTLRNGVSRSNQSAWWVPESSTKCWSQFSRRSPAVCCSDAARRAFVYTIAVHTVATDWHWIITVRPAVTFSHEEVSAFRQRSSYLNKMEHRVFSYQPELSHCWRRDSFGAGVPSLPYLGCW